MDGSAGIREMKTTFAGSTSNLARSNDDQPTYKAKVYPAGGGTVWVTYQRIERDGPILLFGNGEGVAILSLSLHGAVVEFLGEA
jgi:hypothetical protein